MRWAVLLCALAGPAQADMHLAELHAGVLGCNDRVCIGEAATLCMELEEGGDTTTGMVSCLSRETDIWDDLLNEAYQDVRSRARAQDKEYQDTFPENADRAEKLLAAQRAWIAFRDANCAADYALWGPGSIRRLIAADCYLQMTAERTLELRSYLDALR